MFAWACVPTYAASQTWGNPSLRWSVQMLEGSQWSVPWCCRPGHSASCPGAGARGRAVTSAGCGERWAGSGGSPAPPRTWRGRPWPGQSRRPAWSPHQRRSLTEGEIRFMAPLRVSEYISIWKEAREHPEDEWKVIRKLNQTGSLSLYSGLNMWLSKSLWKKVDFFFSANYKIAMYWVVDGV